MERKPILARIRARNLKGRALDVAPSPLTLIVGENASGKTAIREAVLLALMGRHPEFGKMAKSILRLAGGDPTLYCMVELTDNRRFEATWQRKGSGASTSEGARLDLIDTQLDFDSFRQAKPTARQAILEGLLVHDDVALDSRQREEARGLLAVRDLDVSLLEEQEDTPWLDALQEDCRARSLSAKQEADIAGKALLELMSRPKPAAAPSEGELAEAKKTVEQAIRRETRADLKVERLEERLRDAPQRPAGPPPENTALDDLELRIDELDARIEELAGVGGDLQRLSLRIETLRERRGEGLAVEHEPSSLEEPPTEASLREANEAEREAQQQFALLSDKLIQSETQHRQEAARLDNLLKTDRCPTCGAEGANLETALRREMGRLNEVHTQEHQRLEAARREAQTFAAECEMGLDILQDKEKRSAEGMRWAIDRELDSLEAQTNTLAQSKEARAGLIEERAQLHGSRKALREQLNSWQAWRTAAPPDEREVEDAREALRDAVEQQARASEKQVDLLRSAEIAAAAREDQRRGVRLESEREKADGDSKAYKEVQNWAKKRKEERAAARMAKLFQPANRVLTGLELGELEIEGTIVGIAPSTAGPSIGLRPLEVLSGSESTAVAAAIQVAIASQAELRLVIVDELTHMTPTRKAIFLSNLRDAVETGIVDQVIALDHDQRLVPPGWTRFEVQHVIEAI